MLTAAHNFADHRRTAALTAPAAPAISRVCFRSVRQMVENWSCCALFWRGVTPPGRACDFAGVFPLGSPNGRRLELLRTILA
jgi:hypothetical protein